MAKKNFETEARVRLTIGGLSASQSNLKKLQGSVASLKKQIEDLDKQRVEFIADNQIKKANDTAKQIQNLKFSLETFNGMIKLQEAELGNYEDILDNISGHSLRELKKGLSSIKASMQHSLTLEDMERYGQLKDAYDDITDAINQLSMKAPNLRYVMENLNTVSDKSMKDSIEYVNRLIADTDKGSTRLVQLQNQLQGLEWAQKDRLRSAASAAMGKVDGVSFAGTEAEAQQALETLREYKATLNMETEAAEIEKVRVAMDAYNEALEKVKGTAVDIGAILADPKQFSVDQIQKAIKQLEEDGKRIKIGDTEAIAKNVSDIENLKNVLAESSHSQTFIDRVVKEAKTGYASVEELEKAISMTKEKLRRSKDPTVTEKLKQDLDVLNPALELTRTSLTRVSATLANVKDANLGSLKEAAERLRVEINDVNISMDDFAQKSAQLKEVDARIKTLERTTRSAGDSMEGLTGKLGRSMVSLVGFSEIISKVMQAFSQNVELSDAMTDVQKTTGLAADEVARLTDEIQELDTRISNEELMEAAAEAGRIGLQTREEVLQFTRASAITLTALDELDAKALTSVMKLNTLLGETARLGVQQAILSTASSINELSAASAASAQPIIDFARRVGGVASQANLSTAEVLGLGATLDAIGQNVEASSTAISKFTTALLTNGKAIAEDTGLSEEYVFQMTRQGKTIELMVEVLSRLGSMGGLAEITKYMGDMGGDGARATAVISALASNVGFLRDQVDLSKRSFEEGISVINEYNLKNENAAAYIERTGNLIREFFTGSGLVEGASAMAKTMYTLVQWLTSASNWAYALRLALVMAAAWVMSFSKLIVSANTSLKAWIASLMTSSKATATYGEAVRGTGTRFAFFSRMLSSAKTGLAAFTLSVNMAWKANGLLSASLTAVSLTLKGLGRAFMSILAMNPFMWAFTALLYLPDLVKWIGSIGKEVDKTRESFNTQTKAVDKANAAFEEESYKLNKLRSRLDEMKKAQDKNTESAKGFSEIASTLNRDYGKQIGYVIDLAAEYEELAAAIDMARIAKRKQVLEEEKGNVYKEVRDKYREDVTEQSNELKEGLSSVFKFTDAVNRDLYAAVVEELAASAVQTGKAEIGEDSKVYAILKNQAQAWAERLVSMGSTKSMEELTDEYYNNYKNAFSNMGEINRLADVYTNMAVEAEDAIVALDAQLAGLGEASVKGQEILINSLIEKSNILTKAPEDFTEADEETLKRLIDAQNSLIGLIDEEKDPEKLADARAKLDTYNALQNEVLMEFVKNPLRGADIKVGDDGKLYRSILENGKVQYELIENISDANFDLLKKAYRKAGDVYDKFIADSNNRMNSSIVGQAKKLSDFRASVKDLYKQAGHDLDKEGNTSPLDRDPTPDPKRKEREENREGQELYRSFEKKLKEHYEREKQITLEKFVADKLTVKAKNREIERINREHKETLAAMQTELLGESQDVSIFDESKFFINAKNWKKVLDWMLKDTNAFKETIRADREKITREALEMEVKQKEAVSKILLGNDYQAQVDRDMQAALENAGLFWGDMKEQSQENAHMIIQELRTQLEGANRMTVEQLEENLSSQRLFGEIMKGMSQEEKEALLVLLKQYQEKDLEARKKHQDDVRKLMEDSWEASGAKAQYESEKLGIKSGKEQIDTLQSQGAVSDREAFKERQRLLAEELELERMAYEQRSQGITDEAILLEMKQELAEREKEIQAEITETYLEEYNRRADKMSEHAEKFGEFAGVMASAAWNSVEDRKKAGEELLKYIAQETFEYLRELGVRKVKEALLRKAGIGELKKGEEEKHDIEQKGVDVSTRIAEEGGKALIDVEKFTTGTVGQMAEQGAVQSATTAVKEANVKGAAGIAAGASKTIGELGWWGIPLIAAIEGVISMLLNMAMSALSSSFGSSASTSKTSSKRLATGMLTYASGRYPTLGDDGRTYSAQYEPTLRTGVYDGGNGKAHMALFSEVMPEMVVSGRTTKIIQEDFPGLMNAIMMIDKYGTLPQPRRVRRYAGGNVDEFDVEMVQSEDGTYTESPAITELRQSNQELREAVAQLTSVLAGGIQANINMYGAGGIKESMDKANKFYQKNRIK